MLSEITSFAVPLQIHLEVYFSVPVFVEKKPVAPGLAVHPKHPSDTGLEDSRSRIHYAMTTHGWREAARYDATKNTEFPSCNP